MKKNQHSLFDFSYLSPTDVTLEEWCAHYGISVAEHPCLECKAMRRTTVPAYGSTWRGLVAPKCECGFDGPIQNYVLKPGVELPALLKLMGG